MEIYTMFMACLAFFFYREGKGAMAGNPRFLKSLQADKVSLQQIGKLLFFLAAVSAISAILMLFSLLYSRIFQTPLPRIPSALSFLVYGAGFMIAVYRVSKMQGK